MIWVKMPMGPYLWARLAEPYDEVGNALVIINHTAIYMRANTKNGVFENGFNVYDSDKWDGFKWLTDTLLANK